MESAVGGLGLPLRASLPLQEGMRASKKANSSPLARLQEGEAEL